MKKPHLLLPALLLMLPLLLTSHLFAQNFPRKDYDWEEGRKTAYQPTADEQKQPAVIVLDKRYYDYVPSPDTNRLYDVYVTKHKLIHVMDDKGIDAYNKVYIPMEEDDSLIKLKARTINKDGKVIEVTKDNIKDVSNYGQYANLKIFALEGVEKDADVEYLYTLRKGADISGCQTYQTDVKVKDAVFVLTTPANLEFEAKAYNGFTPIVTESKDSTLILHGETKEIPGIQDEQYSTYEANEMKVSYVLAYNRHASDEKLVTWNSAASRYYKLIYPEGLKVPKLDKFIKDIKLSKKDEEEDKIRKIEAYIKENINYKKDHGSDLSDPNSIIVNKVANDVGLNRLYAAIFQQLEIPVYIVMSSNRFETKFDPDFVDYTAFDEILLYFPAYQKFIAPTRVEYRYGPAPINQADNFGLFIKGPYSGTAKYIPQLGVEDNKCIDDYDLTFNSDMDAVTVQAKNSWTGYRAFQIRALYQYSDLDGKNEILKAYTTSGIDDAKVQNRDVAKMTINDSEGDEPAAIDTKYTAASLMENAGNNYLLNVGKLIGTQSELYQEKERQNDIEMENPVQYKHHIHFTVPKGFKVKGLDDAIIDKSLSIDGKRVCQFVSSYTLKDGQVDINVHEFYKNNHIPKDRYEDFRKVINAASDFNKLVLVLEKE